jgi:hypothetical protein
MIEFNSSLTITLKELQMSRITYQEVYEGVVQETGKTGIMISLISLFIYLATRNEPLVK